MTLKAGKNGRIYLSGYDISGKANRFSIALPREFEDVTGFGESGHKWHPTLHNNSFGFDAFYDAAAGNITEIMNTLRGTSGIACLCLGVAREDKAIAGYGVFQQDYPIEMPVDGMLKITGDFVFSDMAVAGYLLRDKAIATSDNFTTRVDDAVPSINGCEAYLHVFACGADDNFVAEVHTSNDNFVAEDNTLITFTVANGITSERKVITSKSGTADDTEANKLHDADGGFTAADVGKVVWNSTDDTYTTVSGFVDSGELDLTDDIMADTDEYTLGVIQRYVRVAWTGDLPYSVTFVVVFVRL